MKRTLHLSAAGCALALALVVAAPVGADVVIQTDEPYHQAILSECTDEMVDLVGTVHTVARLGISSDGRAHIGGSTQFSGLKGIGLDSGARYVATMIENDGGNIDSDFAPTETTTETIQILTRLSEDGTFVEGDDFRAHISAHVVIDANGTAKVERFESSSDCN